jgi:hypothetical protein
VCAGDNFPVYAREIAAGVEDWAGFADYWDIADFTDRGVGGRAKISIFGRLG